LLFVGWAFEGVDEREEQEVERLDLFAVAVVRVQFAQQAMKVRA
jgi:hypothetical protein